ncbi:MAG: hypothetical protein MJE77_46985 [Proteobacteria bacterium]|nr:hypothetical protein [Pseudomonadota bacterium]
MLDDHIVQPSLLARRIGRCLSIIVALLVIFTHRSEVRADFEPLVGIVLCEASYTNNWYSSHSSSQALVGLAGLVGVPYRTLTLRELVEKKNPGFTSVWFSQCLDVSEQYMSPLVEFLQSHVEAGNSVFLDGPLARDRVDSYGNSQYRGMAEELAFLGVRDDGWHWVEGDEVYTTSSTHPVAARAGYSSNTRLTQGMRTSMQIVTLTDFDAPGSDMLLELIDPDGNSSHLHPYLVVTEPGNGARVVAASTYGTSAAPASPIRNNRDEFFYDNQLLPYLVEALLWAVGPGDQPFVGLQLSHAPVTVIGRLDGDVSDSTQATDVTLDYLNDLARQTGVATVYGIVSKDAQNADTWQSFRRGGEELQRLGGSLASHSHSHIDQMSRDLDDDQWKSEIAESLQLIRNNLSDTTFTPDAYAFINPGNTIQSHHYGKFFSTIDLYMTHGFEYFVPYASGVMGFDLPSRTKPKPTINCSPIGDYTWLYSRSWIYTVDEAAENQARILDYYQNTVGRGVLYNQMWHDYSIGDLSPLLHYPDTPSARPLFDANRDHFAANRIYAPSASELVGKMHTAHKVAISSRAQGHYLLATLDYSNVPASHVDHIAGMGVRLNGSDKSIKAVAIDGVPHHAFTNDTVILPPAEGSNHTLAIRLADTPATEARLTYISKSYDQIEKTDGQLNVWLRQPGVTTRFCVGAPHQTVVLHADSYQRSGSGEFCGDIGFASTTPLVSAKALSTGDNGLYIEAAERVISSASVAGRLASFRIQAGEAGYIYFAYELAPEQILIDGEVIPVEFSHGRFSFEVARSDQPVTIEVQLAAEVVIDKPVAPDMPSKKPGDREDPDMAPHTGPLSGAPSGGCSVGARSFDAQLHTFLLFALFALPVYRRRRRK